MNEKLSHIEVESKRMLLRDTKVILDSDVASLYGVETKRVNEAAKKNPDRFPEGYIIALNDIETGNLRSKFSTTNLTKIRVNPNAVTEKGLYMRATILKSAKATKPLFPSLKHLQYSKNLQET